MLFTRAFIPTVKEAPADATAVSHVLLTRAGYVRGAGAGAYELLPLGVRVLRKIEAVVRDEMDRGGALEIAMPALLSFDSADASPADSPDRRGGGPARPPGDGEGLSLGSAHDALAVDLARRGLPSYRDLPKTFYQVTTRLRGDARARGGLLTSRERAVAEAYTLDASDAAARAAHDAVCAVYTRALARLGIAHRAVAGDAGGRGASRAVEIHALAPSFEDVHVACDACGYAASPGAAAPGRRAFATDEGPSFAPLAALEKVHTPGSHTVEEVTAFLGATADRLLKSLLYVVGDEVMMCVVRGDRAVDEVRLARHLGVDGVALADAAEVVRATGAAVGFAGPAGFRGRILVDRSAAHVRDAIAGANETGHHLTGVNRGRDYDGEVVDVVLAEAGDPCPACDAGALAAHRGIMAARAVVLGTRLAEAAGATFADEQQRRAPFVLGRATIDLSRLVAILVEQHHDADGIRWPSPAAPYDVHLCTVAKDAAVLAAGRALHDDLEARGVEVLWDDRDERAGVKFKDADLVGAPWRVTIGAKGLAAGHVEVKPRSEPDGKKAELVPVADAAEALARRVRG